MHSCSFIGHKNCPDEIKNHISHTIEKLIKDKGVNQFYVGTQGNFDKLVYEVLCELEKRYKIKTFVVLAYLSRKPINIYYDIQKTIFPDELTKVPLRLAIRRRNSFMIDKADYLVSYLNTQFSNTYSNIEEAVKKKKIIINLGYYNIENILTL